MGARPGHKRPTAAGPRNGAAWTRAEDHAIEFAWSNEPCAVVAERLGRTPEAVRLRAKRLALRPQRAYHRTLVRASRELGFDARTLVRAIKRLGLAVERLPSYQPTTHAQRRAAKARPGARPRGRRAALGQAPWVITDAQFEQLRRYLLGERPPKPPKAWGVRGRPACCRGCGRTDRPCHTRDRCRPCYDGVLAVGRVVHRGLLTALQARADALALVLAPPVPRWRARAASGPLLDAGRRVWIAFDAQAALVRRAREVRQQHRPAAWAHCWGTEVEAASLRAA